MKFQIVHQVNGPFAGQDWVTNDVPLFDSQEEAESYIASGVLEPQDPYDKTRTYTYYVREADQYPACIADPPTGRDEQCGHEYCPLHTIVWLESEGVSHEVAVGLTAVLDYEESGRGGMVVDALGGFDSWDQVTDFASVWDSGPLTEWYTAHLPLVVYCLEKSSWSAKDYWLQARYRQTRIQVTEPTAKP